MALAAMQLPRSREQYYNFKPGTRKEYKRARNKKIRAVPADQTPAWPMYYGYAA